MTADKAELRDFRFMPLYIERLQRSRAWLACKRRPELAFYMLNLWMRSWHECPAGSLEDDDDVLADAAMADPKTWARIKDAVLRGWIRQEDGRLHHPTVTELAAGAFARKSEQRARTEAARAARAKARASSVTEAATETATTSVTETATANVTRDVTGVVTSSKGQGQGQGQGQGESSSAAFGDSAARAREPAPPPSPQPAKILPVSSAATQVIALFDRRSHEHFGEQTRAFPAATDAVVAQRWLDAGATIALLDGVFSAKFAARKSKGKSAVGSLSYLDECVLDAIRTGSATPTAPRRSGLNPSQDPAVLIRRDANGRLIQPNLNLVAG